MNLNVMAASPRKVVVFSGGSAANSLVDVFNEVIEKHSCALTYVIPISDNGGSSSELIRVFGGPGIGDVRSMKIFSIGLHTRFVLGIVFLNGGYSCTIEEDYMITSRAYCPLYLCSCAFA